MHKIGILSDTHNLLRESVAELLGACDIILHAGDIGSPQILGQLQSIAPVYAVRGNADKAWTTGLAPTLSVELFGIKIFMAHQKKMIPKDTRDRDLVIYGHSHKYEKLQKDGQIWLNPGSCGRRRFALPVTMAVLTTSENGIFQIEQVCLEAAGNAPAHMPSQKAMKDIVIRVMKETDRGTSVEDIAKNCQISQQLAAQVCRLYLTHPGVSADGILGKMGL